MIRCPYRGKTNDEAYEVPKADPILTNIYVAYISAFSIWYSIHLYYCLSGNQ